MCNKRICNKCSREFVPASRHLTCPSCRSKDWCQCGNPKQKHSITCSKCRIPSSPSGPRNGNWRGGKSYTKKGYTLRRVPGHPRVSRGDYVFEHIVVMEEILGRRLLPGENVHHKNGVKHDNRPENLELWARPQPSGVRISDLVEWAEDILRIYREFVNQA